jgi:antitoxin ChpS
MLAVPPALLDVLRLEAGAKVDVTVERGRLVVEPRRKRRYSLDELLAQCRPGARRGKAEREWLGNAPAGRELI